MTIAEPEEILGFLGRPTPAAWVEAACDSLPLLAVDHANCEKKAAATALALMNRYPERAGLVRQMSRLAREELRHFEQVTRLMKHAGIPWRTVTASRYASGLRSLVAQQEPGRLIDFLLVGAFIEARSCERFALLAGRIPAPFSDFYRGLLAAESRHFQNYLKLAAEYAGARVDLDERIAAFRSRENHLISEPDEQIRFHSGPPA